MNTQTQHPAALRAAIDQVNGLLNKTPNSVLAQMYRESFNEAYSKCTDDRVRKEIASTIEVIAISSDDDLASAMRDQIGKAINGLPSKMLKDFLLNVTNGIIAVSRRS